MSVCKVYKWNIDDPTGNAKMQEEWKADHPIEENKPLHRNLERIETEGAIIIRTIHPVPFPDDLFKCFYMVVPKKSFKYDNDKK